MQSRELLIRAKHAIQAGEKSLRSAAEDIASAQAQGATQREIAKAVGKSPGWVNRLLQWRAAGYNENTPFGPPSKAARQRRSVQATEQTKERVEAVSRSEGRKNPRENESLGDGKAPGRKGRSFDPDARGRLIRALDMLGSERTAERASAALQVERLRAELGLTWPQLLVPTIYGSGALAA